MVQRITPPITLYPLRLCRQPKQIGYFFQESRRTDEGEVAPNSQVARAVMCVNVPVGLQAAHKRVPKGDSCQKAWDRFQDFDSPRAVRRKSRVAHPLLDIAIPVPAVLFRMEQRLPSGKLSLAPCHWGNRSWHTYAKQSFRPNTLRRLAACNRWASRSSLRALPHESPGRRPSASTSRRNGCHHHCQNTIRA